MKRGIASIVRTLAVALGVAGLAGLVGLSAAPLAHADEAAATGPGAPSTLGSSDRLGDRILPAQRARPAVRKREPEAAGTEHRAAPGRPTEATTIEWLRRFGRVDIQSRSAP